MVVELSYGYLKVSPTPGVFPATEPGFPGWGVKKEEHMAKDQPEYESKENGGLRSSSGLTVAETLRSVSVCKDEADAKAAPKSEEKISVFWHVFGGTLLSIGALISDDRLRRPVQFYYRTPQGNQPGGGETCRVTPARTTSPAV